MTMCRHSCIHAFMKFIIGWRFQRSFRRVVRDFTGLPKYRHHDRVYTQFNELQIILKCTVMSKRSKLMFGCMLCILKGSPRFIVHRIMLSICTRI